MALRIVPHSISYETVDRLNKYANIILYVSTALSICISLLSFLQLLPPLQATLIVINSLMACIFIYLDNRANYIFTKAEMKRRLDWLDNSFQTNFSGKKSQNYFTNDHLSPGLYKLSVNCFENSFHTQFIVSKMLPAIMLQTIIIVLLFIVSAFIGNSGIIRLFFELALPAVLVQRLIKAIFFSNRIADVHDRFKCLFNDLMKHDFESKTAEALRDILEYETTLAWASTPLDSKLFFKYQDHLAEEWNLLKNEYQIS